MTKEEARGFVNYISESMGTTAMDDWTDEKEGKTLKEAVDCLSDPEINPEEYWKEDMDKYICMYCYCEIRDNNAIPYGFKWHFCPHCGKKKIGVIHSL